MPAVSFEGLLPAQAMLVKKWTAAAFCLQTKIMETKVLFKILHVELARLDSGRYCLTAEDTMVNDYVEDFLWDEFEYEATTVTINERSNRAVYQNYFPADFPVAPLIEALQQLDANEVARIYGMNG